MLIVQILNFYFELYIEDFGFNSKLQIDVMYFFIYLRFFGLLKVKVENWFIKSG